MSTIALSARTDVGGGLVLLALDVSPERARAYETAGQYVQVMTPSGIAYFVLASNVGASPWELLIRRTGGAAEALASLPLGTSFEIDGPLGAGFPVAERGERPVVVAVVGSALAVARPVINLRIAEGAARATYLFLGLPAALDLPIAAEVAAWMESGVLVVLCLSRSEIAHHVEILPQAKRVVGYVQHAVSQGVEAGDVAPGALIVVAGPEALVDDMRSFASRSNDTRIEVVTNV